MNKGGSKKRQRDDICVIFTDGSTRISRCATFPRATRLRELMHIFNIQEDRPIHVEESGCRYMIANPDAFDFTGTLEDQIKLLVF
jgi:hypothetical protein